MKTNLTTSLFLGLSLRLLLMCLLLAACADPKGDNTDPSLDSPSAPTVPAVPTDPSYPNYPAPAPGVVPPGGNSGGNSFIPINNPTEYPTVTGGTFRVTRVATHSNSWSGIFSGIVAEGATIYELWRNPAGLGSTIFRLVKTSETGAASTYCTWYGDGYSYNSISYDGGKLFFRRYHSGLFFQRYNPSICLAETALTYSTQTDSNGFSLVTYGDFFQAIGGMFLIPFKTSSATKMKLLDPALLKYSDYGLEQDFAGEQLRFSSSFVIQNNVLWTATSCKLTYNTICLWKMDLSAGKFTYAFLPKASFPDLGPPDNYTKPFVLKGETSSELRYVVVKDQEVRIYVLDISKF
jgi:hypothetical protein